MTAAPLTQRERVLRALQRVGSHGLTQVDFDLPAVIDGGAPIKRVAARVEELRRDGCRIDVLPARRNRCVVYVLAAPAHQPIEPAKPDPAVSLFGPGPRSAIFGYDPDVAA
jgi:hypothetical protein